MLNDKDEKESDGNKYDRIANTPGSGNKTIDEKRNESQDQVNKDREEQQGKDEKD